MNGSYSTAPMQMCSQANALLQAMLVMRLHACPKGACMLGRMRLLYVASGWYCIMHIYPGGTMRVPSPSDRIYVCARQFTMNLRYAFNNYAFARVRTYVLSTQLCVLRDQLRVLSVRKCADFHENRLIYAYLSTRVGAAYRRSGNFYW